RTPGRKGGDEDIAGRPDHLTIRQGREARDEGREEPEGQQHRHEHIQHQKDLQACQLLKTHGASGTGDHGEDTERLNLGLNGGIRPMARLRASRVPRRVCLFSMPMSAPPTATLKTTTAGTKLLDIEKKGLAGLKR